MNANVYDLVISGGRVIDPESGLDAVRNVGIRGGSIAAVSADPCRAGRPSMLGGTWSPRGSSTVTCTPSMFR